MNRSPLLPSAFMPDALYGVIGSPVAHSLSPLLHNTGFQALGMAAVYLRWDIAPDCLARFVDGMRVLGIRGCSVTIPHKAALLPLLDAVAPAAAAVGAVNTVVLRENRLYGENTDVAGFAAPLQKLDLPRDADVLLLGAGGAALAAAAGLKALGFSRIHIATPSNASHAAAAKRFQLLPVPWEERGDVPAQLLVNATPCGMQGRHENESPYDFSRAASPSGGAAAIVYDMVYTPLQTRFLREAALAGRQCVSGLEMFFGQGDAQFRLWTGQGLPPEARRALEAALYGRPL